MSEYSISSSKLNSKKLLDHSPRCSLNGQNEQGLQLIPRITIISPINSNIESSSISFNSKNYNKNHIQINKPNLSPLKSKSTSKFKPNSQFFNYKNQPNDEEMKKIKSQVDFQMAKNKLSTRSCSEPKRRIVDLNLNLSNFSHLKNDSDGRSSKLSDSPSPTKFGNSSPKKYLDFKSETQKQLCQMTSTFNENMKLIKNKSNFRIESQDVTKSIGQKNVTQSPKLNSNSINNDLQNDNEDNKYQTSTSKLSKPQSMSLFSLPTIHHKIGSHVNGNHIQKLLDNNQDKLDLKNIDSKYNKDYKFPICNKKLVENVPSYNQSLKTKMFKNQFKNKMSESKFVDNQQEDIKINLEDEEQNIDTLKQIEEVQEEQEDEGTITCFNLNMYKATNIGGNQQQNINIK